MKTQAFVIALAAITAGCSGNPSALDSHFGETVSHTIAEQTYDQAASSSNSPRAVTVIDGEKAGGTLDGYRAMVPKVETQPSNVIKLKIED